MPETTETSEAIAPEFLFSLKVHAGRGYLDESRMALLNEIKNLGTVSAAANTLNISYKTAWSWLEAMENAAEEPLVESVQGGASGGTSKLTAMGLKLLEHYNCICEMHKVLLDSMNASHMQQFQDAESFFRRMAIRTSARNQLYGTVGRIWGDKNQAWVDVMIGNLAIVTSRVTRSTVRDMGLKVGTEVTTLTKATCMSITRPDQQINHTRGPINHINGVLNRCVVDEESVLISLEIAQNRNLTALVPIDDWETMLPKIGDELSAWFDPDHVILARLF
ncbi:MAG TPA: TOBE domain-containing protein [Fibrobacteraceae bacterium]|nr:TOBE domain-containing protein [Fibrobacteraceae bacterium]